MREGVEQPKDTMPTRSFSRRRVYVRFLQHPPLISKQEYQSINEKIEQEIKAKAAEKKPKATSFFVMEITGDLTPLLPLNDLLKQED